MDLYCSDKKLSELGDSPLGDFLDSEVFTPPTQAAGAGDHFGMDTSGAMDSDWLDNFFDDPVLNDRMISDALQPPNVQSEHSYSLANGGQAQAADLAAAAAAAAAAGQTLDLSKPAAASTAAVHKELDMELTAVNPNMMSLPAGQQQQHAFIKQEPLDLTLDTEMTTVTVTRSTNPQTLLKQPTIILAQPAAQQLKPEPRLVLPKVNIKLEPKLEVHDGYALSPEHTSDCYDNLSLPPTPPSSTNSDSDGGASPNRSPPSSPLRSGVHRHHRPISPPVHQPFFMSPIPTSGVLVLTEEEKRTLISEGYPIPGKLPLTKQEEKNLKKIRRKIKNKISAQESRRKKKEYLETLERKVESYSQENTDLRKKVDSLQSNNQSLMSQLHKLQSIVRSISPAAPAHTTSTCLMVMVLCFAVFLGSWSPTSLSIGYSALSPAPVAPVAPAARPQPPPPLQGLGVAPQQPATNEPHVGAYGAYATANSVRSRVLLSVPEAEEEEAAAEEEAAWGPAAPLFSYKQLLGRWLGSCDKTWTSGVQPEPVLPKVQVLDVSGEINQTGGAPRPQTPPPSPQVAVTTPHQANANATA